MAKRWRAHGLDRLPALADECGGGVPAVTRLDARELPEALAAEMLEAVAVPVHLDPNVGTVV